MPLMSVSYIWNYSQQPVSLDWKQGETASTRPPCKTTHCSQGALEVLEGGFWFLWRSVVSIISFNSQQESQKAYFWKWQTVTLSLECFFLKKYITVAGRHVGPKVSSEWGPQSMMIVWYLFTGHSWFVIRQNKTSVMFLSIKLKTWLLQTPAGLVLDKRPDVRQRYIGEQTPDQNH